MIQAKQRIDFIDLVKGWVIFLVIWVHTDHPSWVIADFVNSAFFLLSGVFFKKYEFGTFSTKQVNSLLIPFIFFYLISYPFRIVMHYWDFRTLETFDWGCILDIFDSASRSDYLFINVPLWFILCIFFVRYCYWLICKAPKLILLLIAILLFMLREQINSIATPFMINNAVYWLGFFIVGNLSSKWLTSENKKSKISAIGITGLLGLILYIAEVQIESDFLLNAITHVERLSLIIFTILIFSFVRTKYLAPLKFMGENTLAILGYHLLILIPFSRLAHKISGGEVYPYLIGLPCSILTAIVLYFVIKFSNKYIPSFVGKGNLIK